MNGGAVEKKIKMKYTPKESVAALFSINQYERGIDLHRHIHRDDVLLKINLGVQACVSDQLDDPAFTLISSEAKA